MSTNWCVLRAIKEEDLQDVLNTHGDTVYQIFQSTNVVEVQHIGEPDVMSVTQIVHKGFTVIVKTPAGSGISALPPIEQPDKFSKGGGNHD